MRWVVLIISLALLVGTGSGYWLGSIERTKHDAIEGVFLYTIPRLDPDGRYVLSYECDSKILAEYDVDKDILVTTEPSSDEVNNIVIHKEERNWSRALGPFGVGLGTGGIATFWKPIIT